MKIEVSQEYLKSILTYDQETGVFIWKRRPLDHFKRFKDMNMWNTKYVDTVAGSIDPSNGYYCIVINRQKYKAHRLAWLYHTGSLPVDQIDHINQVRDDNRIENLREATVRENLKNKSMSTLNTSGTVGVSWNKRLSQWLVSISADGEKHYLGIYHDKEEAIKVRKDAEVKYGFSVISGQPSPNKIKRKQKEQQT